MNQDVQVNIEGGVRVDDPKGNPRFYAKQGKIYFKHQIDNKTIIERPARQSDAEQFPEIWESTKIGGGVKKCLS